MKPEDDYNERGYASDFENMNYKSKKVKKHKNIVNKKQKINDQKRRA